MSKRICALALLVLAGLASTAEATLVLVVQQDGSGAIVNEGSEPITFDGYQIQDAHEPGRFIPENLRSVESLIAAGDIGSVLITLGAGALGFATAGLSPNNLAELTAGSGGRLQPGARWSLGNPFPVGLPVGTGQGWAGITFAINAPSDSAIRVEVPEPTSRALAGVALLGGLAAARRLRRAAPPR